MTIRPITAGHPSAPVWFVLEAPGEDEIVLGQPVVGATGQELHRMLAEAGWLTRDEARQINNAIVYNRDLSIRDRILARRGYYLTNVCHERPPGNEIESFFLTATEARKQGRSTIGGRYPNAFVEDGRDLLLRDIDEYRPRTIILLGNTGLWAVHGVTGITKWRGSIIDYHSSRTVCTLHIAAVLREWPWRRIVIEDLRRAMREHNERTPLPSPTFHLRPTLRQVEDFCHAYASTKTPVVSDTETRGGHIACIGFAPSPHEAMCIPLMQVEGDGNYWPSADDELRAVRSIRLLLRASPTCFHNGQYDTQVIARDWGFLPKWTDDTMVMQHVAFPGLLGAGIDPLTGATSKKGSSLSLAFISSMYCAYHCFWKDDGRLWNPETTPEDDYWRYNCEDCVRTSECQGVLDSILTAGQLQEQYRFVMDMALPVMRMMFRGLEIDLEARASALRETQRKMDATLRWIESAVGHPFNPNADQAKAFFYDDLRQRRSKTKAGRDSLDDDALERIKRQTPVLRPLIQRIQDYRTLAVLAGKSNKQQRNILNCHISDDGMLRATSNLCGTETFRFSSGPTAFDEGCNLQNIAKPRDD